jgi:hypothetical protein
MHWVANEVLKGQFYPRKAGFKLEIDTIFIDFIFKFGDLGWSDPGDRTRNK